jgi:hypothetical protein
VKSITVGLQELDQEWLELMIEAKSLGLELTTVREFLKENAVGE